MGKSIDNDISKMQTQSNLSSEATFIIEETEATVQLNSAATFVPCEGENGEAPELENKYHKIEEIGRGGMGKVELWKDQNINRVVASKLILKEKNASHEMLQRFYEEGQITGQLEHPNIVPIYEIGADDSQNLYFTMKYVKGQSLKVLIEGLVNDKQLLEEWSLSRRLQIFQNICYAMDYAHSKNVIHRDLKPDNIMLGNFGEVMVMDWGLAKVVGEGQEVLSENSVATLRSEGGFKTIAGQIAGTPLYMSPEQAGGEMSTLDCRSDVYSLGAILYELVTGSRCVKGDTLPAILTSVSQGKIRETPTRDKFGTIPKELRHIIKKSLQVDKEKRYQSARELAEDIQRFVDGKEVKACHYSLADKFWKFTRKHKKELALIAATLLIISPGFWWLYTQQRHKEKEIREKVLADEGQKMLSDDEFLNNLALLKKLQKKDGPPTTLPPKNKKSGRARPKEDKSRRKDNWFNTVAKHFSGQESENKTSIKEVAHVKLSEDQVEDSMEDEEKESDVSALSAAGDAAPRQPSREEIERRIKEAAERRIREETERKIRKEIAQKKQEEEKKRKNAKDSFKVVKKSLLKSINYYRKAYEVNKEYRFKKAEADAWLKLYEAARYVEDDSWQEVASYQIQGLVNEKDYKKYYQDKIE